MKTTVESISESQVRALRTEAINSGDSIMAEVCDRALGVFSGVDEEGLEDMLLAALALVECVRVISKNEAQENAEDDVSSGCFGGYL